MALYLLWALFCFGKKTAFKRKTQGLGLRTRFSRVHKAQKKKADALSGLSTKIPEEELKKYDNIVKATLDNFGDWTASNLVNWTHKQGSAWDKKYNYDEKYATLDNHDIMLDFEGILDNG